MGLLKKYVKMFREDMKEAMSRRCGLDELNNFIMLVAFLYVVAALATGIMWFAAVGAVLIALGYFRVFSKNLEKRKKENAVYMKYLGGFVNVISFCKKSINMWWKSLKDPSYVYFVCSSCHQIIRIPRGKNKISIRCPKCGKTFVKRT